MRFIRRALASSTVCARPAATGAYRTLVRLVAVLRTALVLPTPVLCHRLRLLACGPGPCPHGLPRRQKIFQFPGRRRSPQVGRLSNRRRHARALAPKPLPGAQSQVGIPARIL